MKFRLMKIIYINLFFFILIFFSFKENLSAKNFEANYIVEVGNVDLGTLRWLLDIDENNYKTSIFLQDKGFLSLFYKFDGKYYSEGSIYNNDFLPTKYNQLWKTKKKNRKIEIFFKNQKVINFSMSPKELNPPRINLFDTNNLIDPLSSFLNILKENNNNYKTTDGRRVYKMLATKDMGGSENSKKIIIEDYLNIWADHNKNDLEYIYIIYDNNLSENIFFPNRIKIKNRGLVFNLTKT